MRYLLLFMILFNLSALGQPFSFGDSAVFGGAGARPWNQELGTQLKMWFSHKSLSGDDGTTVSVWSDSSGNGFATNAAPSSSPYVTNSTIFGHSVLRFSDAQQLLVSSNLLGVLRNVASASVIVRCAVFTNDAGTPFLISKNAANSSRIYLYISATGAARVAGKRLDADSTVLSDETAALSWNTARTFQLDVDWSASTAQLWVNHALLVNDSTWGSAGNTSDTDSIHITIGGINTSTEPFNGLVSDVIVVVPKLSDSMRTNVWTAEGI